MDVLASFLVADVGLVWMDFGFFLPGDIDVLPGDLLAGAAAVLI